MLLEAASLTLPSDCVKNVMREDLGDTTSYQWRTMVHDVNVLDVFLLSTPLRQQSACWRDVEKFCLADRENVKIGRTDQAPKKKLRVKVPKTLKQSENGTSSLPGHNRLDSGLYSSHTPKWNLESGTAVPDTLEYRRNV